MTVAAKAMMCRGCGTTDDVVTQEADWFGHKHKLTDALCIYCASCPYCASRRKGSACDAIDTECPGCCAMAPERAEELEEQRAAESSRAVLEQAAAAAARVAAEEAALQAEWEAAKAAHPPEKKTTREMYAERFPSVMSARPRLYAAPPPSAEVAPSGPVVCSRGLAMWHAERAVLAASPQTWLGRLWGRVAISPALAAAQDHLARVEVCPCEMPGACEACRDR